MVAPHWTRAHRWDELLILLQSWHRRGTRLAGHQPATTQHHHITDDTLRLHNLFQQTIRYSIIFHKPKRTHQLAKTWYLTRTSSYAYIGKYGQK